MGDNEVIQSQNEAGGDMAGRDVIKNYTYYSSSHSISTLESLYRRFEDEKRTNPALKEFIDGLDYYNKPIDGNVLGVEQKLKDGKHESFVEFALLKKEQYHKLLYRYQFSEVAQKINFHLLGLVESYFMTYIYPKICDGRSTEEIQNTIQERIINPLLDQLGENTLGFSAGDIQGMIYFLTGNCHLKWTK